MCKGEGLGGQRPLWRCSKPLQKVEGVSLGNEEGMKEEELTANLGLKSGYFMGAHKGNVENRL